MQNKELIQMVCYEAGKIAAQRGMMPSSDVYGDFNAEVALLLGAIKGEGLDSEEEVQAAFDLTFGSFKEGFNSVPNDVFVDAYKKREAELPNKLKALLQDPDALAQLLKNATVIRI